MVDAIDYYLNDDNTIKYAGAYIQKCTFEQKQFNEMLTGVTGNIHGN